jgi:hypothetical protein
VNLRREIEEELRMVDITEISAIVAAAGVLVGVAYYILDMRNQTKLRQTDLVAKLYSAFTTDDFLQAILKILNLEFVDYRDFVKKYGHPLLETSTNVAIYKLANYFDEAGILLHRGLIDATMTSEFMMPSTLSTWNKLKPIIVGVREETGFIYFRWFEYLYNEMKKREQRQ